MERSGIQRLIERHAKAAWPDHEYDRGIEIAGAEELFLPIFSEEQQAWIHAPNNELMFGPDRVYAHEVASSTHSYLQMPWLRDPWLDWLFADAMVFQEVNSTIKALAPGRGNYDSKGEPIIWLMLLKGLFQIALWVVWAGIVLAVYSEAPIGAAIIVAITAAYQYKKYRQRKRLGEVFQSMIDTYGALDSAPPSWRNLLAYMEKSRDKGAKWPTVLYRLVERNLA